MDTPPAYPPLTADGPEPPPPRYAEAEQTNYKTAAYEQELNRSWTDPNFEMTLPFYGFDYVRLCTGHGDDVGGDYGRWFAANRTDDSQQPGPQQALAQSEYGSPQTYQTAVPTHLHPTAYVAQETINYLQEHAQNEASAPFFIQCSFPDPHHPFCPPGHYWDMYDPHDVTLPDSFYQSSRDQTPPLAHVNRQKQAGYPAHWTMPFMADEMPAKEMVAKTYGMISFIDDAVGQVMTQLAALGLAENTIVCFMSDHGDWQGAHGLFLKGPFHYQGVIRVPFIWRDIEARYNNGRQQAIASTLDFGATVLHRAGLAPFNGNQGHNLLPVLAGEANGRDNVLIEQTTQYLYLGFDHLLRIFSLVSQQWRLTVWEGESWGELYDLANDPEELENLWHNPHYAAQKSQLLWQMVQRMQSLQDNSPYPTARA
jgi:arylsulfatase A-like enzyme